MGEGISAADLRQYRERRGITQQDLAELLNSRTGRNYGKANVSKWENGTEGVPEIVQRAIAPCVFARVIAIANQKGGVAKTTSTLSLAYALSEMSYRVLLVDADPQGNATLGAGLKPVELDQKQLTINHVLFGETVTTPIETAIQHCAHFDVLPAALSLAKGEIRARSLPGGDTRLKHALRPMLKQYDFILIDTPPNLGPMTMNALAAAGDVLIPTVPAPLDAYGVDLLLQAIGEAQHYLNPEIQLLGLLPTMYDKRNVVDREQLKELTEKLGSVMEIFAAVPRATDVNKSYYNGEVPLAAVGPNHPIRVYHDVARRIVAKTVLAGTEGVAA